MTSARASWCWRIGALACVWVSSASVAQATQRPSNVAVRSALLATSAPAVDAEIDRTLAAMQLFGRVWAPDAECDAEALRLACVEVSQPSASALRIVVIDARGAQRTERTLQLTERGVDVVALEELSQIVESSLTTLAAFLAPTSVADGVVSSTMSVGQPLSAAPNEVPAWPAPEPPASPIAADGAVARATAAQPPGENTSGSRTASASQEADAAIALHMSEAPRASVSRASSPAAPPRLTLALGYEVATWGALWIAGPRAHVRWAWRSDTPRYGLDFALWSGVPAKEEGAGARAALWPSALRAALFVEQPLTRVIRFGGALGLWAGMLRVSAKVTDDELRDEAASTRFDAGLRVALNTRVQLLPQLSLLFEPALDLTPVEIRLGVERVAGFRPIMTVATVRPSAALLLAMDL